MNAFKAKLDIIGINPFVFVPDNILDELFLQAGKTKGNIPVCGTVNGVKYHQTLLRYKGEWRLYINLTMLPDSPKKIGEIITVTIEHDTTDRTIPMHPKLARALDNDEVAKRVFENQTPSLQKEIIRYISYLKSEKSIHKNVLLALVVQEQNK